jgi:DNA-binding beta-propeller fold protein YncE
VRSPSAVLALLVTFAGCSGSPGRLELVAEGLNTPFGVAFDAADNMYVVEFEGNRILKAAPGGKLEPFAGTGEAGFGGDGGPALEAQFNQPHSIATLPGKLYVADTHNHRIRVIDLSTGIIDTLVGTGERARSEEGAVGKAAALNGPFSVAARDGKLYVADLFNLRVVVIDAMTSVVHTIAGNGEKGVPEDGARANAAPLLDPRSAAIDSRGNVYILSRQGNALRVVDPQETIRTIIGPDHPEIHLAGPKFIAIDFDGDAIIADDMNHRVIEYNPDGGRWRVLAGTGTEGDAFVADDPLATQLRRPHGVAVHPSGDVYVCDSYNGRVLRLVR